MIEKANLLIVDDEADILLSLKMYLEPHFGKIQTETNPYQIPRHLRKESYDLVLLDMNFKKGDTSGKEGLMWLEKILELKPNTSIVMFTAYADVTTAVDAVKKGAVDFIEKPWRNEKLLATLFSAYKLHQSKKEVKQLEDKQAVLLENVDQKFNEIIGDSPAMQQVFQLIEKVAKTDANVLILGENGTGKELIARAIHRKSLRNGKTFVNVDLGAVTESLFESELFGHLKGAFTDAQKDRMGRFEVASGGTLFLDEIGNLNQPLQAKLLTVLQNRAVLRVGSNTPIPIDIRLICATNMPLYEMVEEHQFRQDLLYRINTVEIKLPSLKDRPTDIPALTEHFLKMYCKKYQTKLLKLKKATLDKLMGYSWPGNIRELRHAIERAVILCDGDELGADDFILSSKSQEKSDLNFDKYNLELIEKWAIRKVLTKHAGNISRAADELGLTRPALYRRMAKYDL